MRRKNTYNTDKNNLFITQSISQRRKTIKQKTTNYVFHRIKED